VTGYFALFTASKKIDIFFMISSRGLYYDFFKQPLLLCVILS